MKKIPVLILVFILIGSGIYFIFFNKTDEEKIEERLSIFCNNYSSGNLEGCIDCFDTKSRNAYKSIGKLGSLIGGKKGIFSFDLGTDTIASVFSIAVVKEDAEIEFKIKSIDFENENTANITTDIVYFNKSSEESNELSFKMIKEKAPWYSFWSNNWYIKEDFSL